MRKLVQVRENEIVVRSATHTVMGDILWLKADTGWYRCLILDDDGMGYDGDGKTMLGAYSIAARQWEADDK